MSKFLLNLLLQFPKALLSSKKPNFIQKTIFLLIRPNRPSGQPACPSSQPSQPPAPSPFLPQAMRACSAHPGLRGIGIFAKRRLLFKFAQLGDDAFSLCHRQAGPNRQLHLPPSVGRSRSTPPPLSATPRHPALTPPVTGRNPLSGAPPAPI
jgi:hypothetical protein